MIQSLLLKRRAGAAFVLFSWLLLTVFSCGAMAVVDDLSSSAASIEHARVMAMPGSQHYDMAASSEAGVSHDMPCCDPSEDATQLASACCDDILVLPNAPSLNKTDSDLTKHSSGLVIAFSDDDYSLKPLLSPNNIRLAATGRDHCFTDSFPRLHVVHCTFLD